MNALVYRLLNVGTPEADSGRRGGGGGGGGGGSPYPFHEM